MADNIIEISSGSDEEMAAIEMPVYRPAISETTTSPTSLPLPSTTRFSAAILPGPPSLPSPQPTSTAPTSHQCSLCPRTYANYRSLTRHRRLHHQLISGKNSTKLILPRPLSTTSLPATTSTHTTTTFCCTSIHATSYATTYTTTFAIYMPSMHEILC